MRIHKSKPSHKIRENATAKNLLDKKKWLIS